MSYGGAGSYQPKDCNLQNGSNSSDCDGALFNLDLYIKMASCRLDGKFKSIFEGSHGP